MSIISGLRALRDEHEKSDNINGAGLMKDLRAFIAAHEGDKAEWLKMEALQRDVEHFKALADTRGVALSEARMEIAQLDQSLELEIGRKKAVEKAFIDAARQALEFSTQGNRLSERMLELVESGRLTFEEATAPHHD